MGSLINLENRIFGRLAVLGRSKNKGKHVQWECRCTCGNLVVVSTTNLRSGHTLSCGCFRLDRIKEVKTTHGHTIGGKSTKSYMRWQAMIKRCTNPNDKDYKTYGAVGVSVCERWLDFSAFHVDMGDCPEGFSLERKEVTEGYNPDNCVWADASTQTANRKLGNHTGARKTQSGRYTAGVAWRGVTHHLGTFDTVEEASAWRDAYVIANGWPHRLNYMEVNREQKN